MVNLAGPVDLFAEGQLYQRLQTMQARHFREAGQEAILALWSRYYEDAADDRIEAEVLAKVRPWQAKGMGAFVPPDTVAYPPEASPHAGSFWYLHRLSVLDRLEMPVFMIYGEYDKLVPAEPNLAMIAHVFAETGKSNYDVFTFPRASHAFTTPEGHLVRGFFETQIAWVLDQVDE